MAVLNVAVKAQGAAGGLVATLEASGKLLPDLASLPPNVRALLTNYQPFGKLTPAEFVATYWDATKVNRDGTIGDWDWTRAVNKKDVDGFLNGVSAPILPKAGDLWDRFGPTYGRYLSPEGIPYAERGLPPTNLNPTELKPGESVYHAYRWLKDWTKADAAKYGQIMEGKIAPAFGQDAGGTQYMLPGKIPGSTDFVNVQWLLDNDYIGPA